MSCFCQVNAFAMIPWRMLLGSKVRVVTTLPSKSAYKMLMLMLLILCPELAGHVRGNCRCKIHLDNSECTSEVIQIEVLTRSQFNVHAIAVCTYVCIVHTLSLNLKLYRRCYPLIVDHFYSEDHGTLYQLRSKLNRTNVVQSPKMLRRLHPHSYLGSCCCHLQAEVLMTPYGYYLDPCYQ